MCPLLTQNPLHSFRLPHDITSNLNPSGFASRGLLGAFGAPGLLTDFRSRAGSLLELVLADPQVQLRA